MFSWILYYLFRTFAQVYLYFTNTAGNWKTLQDCWEKNGLTYERYRIQNEGHTRFFVFIKNNDLYLNPELDWHQIIALSDSILACTINPVQSVDSNQIEITDTIKEFSHYIHSNPFLTFNDLFSLFSILDAGENYSHYNLMIIFDDLSEKECIVKCDDSLQMIFQKKNDQQHKYDPLEEVPFM